MWITSIFLFIVALAVGSVFNIFSKRKFGKHLSFVSPVTFFITMLPLFERAFFTLFEMNRFIQMGGLTLVVFGLVWRIAWHFQWLRDFGGTHSQLVSTGLYSKVRHPMWLGLQVLLMGLYFSFGVVSGFVLMVIFWIPYMVKQIRQEETFLTEKFSETYEA